MAQPHSNNFLHSLTDDARCMAAVTTSLERIAGSLSVINSLLDALRLSEERHLPATQAAAEPEHHQQLEWDKRPRTFVPERRLRTLLEVQ